MLRPRYQAFCACCLALFTSFICLAQAGPVEAHSIADLRAGFKDPPPPARLRCYWWWLNGNTDEATITSDLEQMKQKGFGGVLLVDANGANQGGNEAVPAGPTFGTPAWIKLYTHALREADRLGLEVTLNITSGWNLGGPDVTPVQASKLLTWTRTTVHGGQQVHLVLPTPPAKNDFYRQIAVLAYPLQHGEALAPQPNDHQGDRYIGGGTGRPDALDAAAIAARQSARTLAFRSAAAETGFSMPDASPMLNPGADVAYADTPTSSVLNLSSQVNSDNTLEWKAPAGLWEVLRIGYTDSGACVSTSSGAWQGLAIDYMSREAFDGYWHREVEPLLQAAKRYHSLVALATDSWELGGTNWTLKFREQFQQLRGYDPVPWLPVVAGRIVGDRDQSTRFLTDLRRTVADLIVSEHYDVFAEHAHAYGLGVQAESGGPHGAPIDALENFRHAAVPQSEFWSENAHRNSDVERFFTKEAASAANIYGQHFVAQEGETSVGPEWSESLATDLKPSFDMAITEGLNRLVWHEFTSSPASTGLPGQEYFAGTHLNPKVTWWHAGGAFFTYLNRVQFLMQQGSAVNDVLYFYGDSVPNFVRLKADDPAHVLPGYDYDVTDEDALLHNIRAENGKLSGPSGVQWRALAVPRTGRLSMAVLAFVDRYVAEGGIVIGQPPSSVTGQLSPQQQEQFTATVSKIWGGSCVPGSPHTYGKGQVFCTEDSHAALEAMHVPPDAEALQSGLQGAAFTSAFDYAHRNLHGIDVYFVRNGSGHAITTDVAFRISGATPELWDAVSGSTDSGLKHEPMADGRTRVTLSLPPFGSAVVLFADKDSQSLVPSAARASRSEPLTVLDGWTVTFQPGRGAPAEPVHMQELISWTESIDPRIRFFSGTATYRATVQAPEKMKGAVYLVLSNLHEVAQVRINGKDAGTIWAKPLSLRVNRLLRPGRNDLEIEVTNLWPNRIIGDKQPGVEVRHTRTNITSYGAGSPLLPSGLIGPVFWSLEDQ